MTGPISTPLHGLVPSQASQLLGQEMPSISAQIWDMKYRFKRIDPAAAKDTPPEVIDDTVAATFDRVATALAQVEPEKDRHRHAADFAEAMSGFKFLPAGRILAGAGVDRNVTLFNCYVVGEVPDSLDGIFDMLRQSALTLQTGGGIGVDFSTIRPKGAFVKGAGADASGPLSFMDVWDSMCRTMLSAGSRRGAMMATMRCDHPDILDFIEAKRDPQRLRMFNLSVLATDPFMDAVNNDAEWQLNFDGKVYARIPARDLWDRIMKATYDVAEPGVIFIDRMNQQNKLSYCETLVSTNPCGEAPLPPWGNCLLGSINLAAFVEDPFGPDATVDLEELDRVVRIAVRMLDNVIDTSKFPIHDQFIEAFKKRRMGLGVMGLGDALAMLGVRYGSDDAVHQARFLMGVIQEAAFEASIGLAIEKGAFPSFDRDAYLNQPEVQALPDVIRRSIAEHGIRNPILTSIAPTGTIALFAHNVSGGIEPIFGFGYWRMVLQNDGSRTANFVEDFAFRMFRKTHAIDLPQRLRAFEGQPVTDLSELPALNLSEMVLPDGVTWPDSLVTVADLTPEDHLVMQAAVQPHVDQSISKTINLPAEIPFEDFKEVYLSAYRMGCKGCTTYRPNEVTGSVLSIGSTTTDGPKEEPDALAAAAGDDEKVTAAQDVFHGVRPARLPEFTITGRPEELPGRVTKFKWPACDHAFYVTITDLRENGQRRPFEIFVNTKNPEHAAWIMTCTRMISALFRRGGDVRFIAREMQEVYDPTGAVAWAADGEKRVPVKSIPAMIGRIIERHLDDIAADSEDPGEFEPSNWVEISGSIESIADPASPTDVLATCPKCASPMNRASGCDVCPSCGHSKCG